MTREAEPKEINDIKIFYNEELFQHSERSKGNGIKTIRILVDGIDLIEDIENKANAKWQQAVQKLKEELPVFMKEKNGTSIWNTHLIIDKIFGELTE